MPEESLESQKNEQTLDDKKAEILEKLKSEWDIEEFVQFNEFNVGEKLQKHAYMLVNHLQKLENEKFQLQKLESLLEQVEGEAFERILLNSDVTLKSSEIQKFYIPRDEKVKRVKKAILLQKFVVSYFEITTKTLTGMGYSLKNFVDTLKWNG